MRVGSAPTGAANTRGSRARRRADLRACVPDVERLNVMYLGPFALSTFIGAVEMGIVLCMYLHYLMRAAEHKESLYIRIMVTFVVTVAW